MPTTIINNIFKMMLFRKSVMLRRSQKILSSRAYTVKRNPFTRTWNMIFQDLKSGFVQKPIQYPEHADVVIIGGGYIGLSVAYWLKVRAGEGLSVVVLEKNLTNVKSQNTLSHGIISQNFSLPENILLSEYSVEFLRNIQTIFTDDTDIKFCPHNSLLLASEKYSDRLEHNTVLQREHGIHNKLLTVDDLNIKFPWINTSGIKLGSLSTETEGIFDAEALYKGMIKKTHELGVIHVNAEATGFAMEVQRDLLMEGVAPGTLERIKKVIYKTSENEEIELKFAFCVIAGGSESSKIANLAKIGSGEGLLTIPLPIEKREYNVYSIKNEENKLPLGLSSPFTMDTSGLWLRRNGLHNNFISGQIPSLQKDLNVSDREIFNSSLYNRYPNCQNMEISVLGTEYIDCNTYDDTGILGPHPYHTNVIFATGFGRHGVYHAPGIGRAAAELIIDCQYTTIDLTRFGFDRLLIDEPLIEFNVY